MRNKSSSKTLVETVGEPNSLMILWGILSDDYGAGWNVQRVASDPVLTGRAKAPRMGFVFLLFLFEF